MKYEILCSTKPTATCLCSSLRPPTSRLSIFLGNLPRNGGSDGTKQIVRVARVPDMTNPGSQIVDFLAWRSTIAKQVGCILVLVVFAKPPVCAGSTNGQYTPPSANQQPVTFTEMMNVFGDCSGISTSSRLNDPLYSVFVRLIHHSTARNGRPTRPREYGVSVA